MMKPELRLFDLSLKSRDRTSAVLLKDAVRIRAKLKDANPAEKILRKFVVVKSDKKTYVIVGPEFIDKMENDTYYFHRDLRQVALHLLDAEGEKGYQISGGGTLSIANKDWMGGWYADVGGSSSDYGAYDPSILPYAQDIADWLCLKTLFSWSGRCEPSKKK